MAVARLAAWTVGVTQQTKAKLQHMVHVTGTRNDVLKWALTVVALLESVATASYRQLGARIWMDKGDGSLSQVMGNEIAPEVRLSGTLDGFGSRELSFTRYGDDQSPFKNSLLRGMRRVTMSGVAAIPGSFQAREMFDGYFRDTDYEGFPPVARITAQDTSVAYASIPMVYTLDAGSGTSRQDILVDVCADHGIPLGTVDFPDGTGGYVYKAISEGGERMVLDWIGDFLGPTGCRAYWRDGKLNVRRFDATRTAVRTLGAGNIRSITITPPATNSPNVARVTGAMFDYTGPSGRRTVPVFEEVTGTYAPLVATRRQNTDGTFTALTLSASSETRVIRRLVGSRVYDGGTLVEEHINEFGWAAPRACNKRQDTAGTIAHNNSFPVYEFSDGSWRATIQEEFRQIGSRNLVRSFDSETGFLTSEIEYVAELTAREIPRASLKAADGTEEYLDVLMTEDGVAWSGGMEQLIFPERNTYRYFEDAAVDGMLAKVEMVIDSFTATEYLLTIKPAGAYGGATIYVFGPSDAKKYATVLGTGGYGLATRTTQYGYVSETSHRVRTFTNITPNIYPRTFQITSVGASDGVFPGGMPSIEQLTDYQEAQPATVTLKDQLRIALSLNKELPEFRQIDFCENPAELETVCLEILREVSAPRVTIETFADLALDEGEVVVVDHPKLGHQPVNLVIWSRDLSLNGATGANSQTLNCRWYTPEIEDNE
jgi:hypothetical protein